MKELNMKNIAVGLPVLFFAGTVNASVITDENFEEGAVGWSNNTTTNSHSPLTSFLGRFGQNQLVSKDFVLSGKQTEVTIAFDFYEIDSWDYENFNFYVDNTLIFSDQFKHNREDFTQSHHMSAESLLFPSDDGNQNLAFSPRWSDQAYHYSYTFNTNSTSLNIGFQGTVVQSLEDESWGIDNVVITDNFVETAVPEPGSFALLGLAVVGLGSLRHKKYKAL